MERRRFIGVGMLLAAAAMAGASGGRRTAAPALRLSTFALPPVVVDRFGEADGPLAELMRQAAAAAALDPQLDLVPLARLLTLLERGGTIAFPVSLLLERQVRFRIVTLLYTEGLHFAVVPGRPPIDTLEQARTLSRIGVYQGSASEMVLRQAGLTNLEPVRRTVQGAAKLYAGHVDAWFATRTALRGGETVYGTAQGPLVIGHRIRDNPLGIGASHDVPEAVMDRLRSAVDALRPSALYQGLIGLVG